MSDVYSAKIRSSVMSKIRSKDTKPERAVRSALFQLGYRFRLHRTGLPGTPDIVLPKYRAAIFVHGCFWHQHPGCKLAKHPKSHQEYWNPKLDRNVERDLRNIKELNQLGWRTLIVWECQVSNKDALDNILKTFIVESSI